VERSRSVKVAQLIASDDPQRVVGPAILVDVMLPAGRSRLSYNHVNGSDADLVLNLVLTNETAAGIPFRFRAGHGGPGVDPLAVGHLACAAFLQTGTDTPAQLDAGVALSLIARLFSPGMTLCGIFEIEAGLPIHATVACVPPGARPGAAVPALRPAKLDPGNHSGGVFRLGDIEEPAVVPFGQPAIVGDLPLVSTSGANLAGNYGIVRTFDFVLPTDLGATQRLRLTFEPLGGPANATVLLRGESYEVIRRGLSVPVHVTVVAIDPADTHVRFVTISEFNSAYPVRFSLTANANDLSRGSQIRTIAGVPSATGLAAIANVSKPPSPKSRVMEPLATRLLQEPDSLLAHKYDVILQLDMSRAHNGDEVQTNLAKLFASAEITPVPRIDASHGYVFAQLTRAQIEALLRADSVSDPLVLSAWEDHVIHPLLIASVPLVKGDAAHSAFAALGEGIVWAVLDSGIEPHPHFDSYDTLEPPAGLAHRDFTADSPSDVDRADLRDPYGHGTHVAGIIAGAWVQDGMPNASHTTRPNPSAAIVNETFTLPRKPTGVAPKAKLLSMRVLDDSGSGNASNVIAALDEIFRINGYGGNKRIHGVNLSVGYSFDPSWDACGRTPICAAVNRLVDSGVIVVVAAGNSGDMFAAPLQSSVRSVGLFASINDPGNADRAITVASCYNHEPFVDGIAASSSKGPTADGRPKPDISAPGEHVISCATVGKGAEAGGAHYIEMSGTSMAAPHVSGAIAAFLSVRREFIGRPDDIKNRIARHATDLARDRTFQGAGLINLFAMLGE
jgi:serine protease AprX